MNKDSTFYDMWICFCVDLCQGQTWGQFNSGIGIDGQFQFQWN